MPRASSNFSLAAKILFDSAQKVGAVGHLSKSGSTYSRQAQKIYANSKSSNGSLNSVSLKVSKFLESRKSEPLGREKKVNLKLPSFSTLLDSDREVVKCDAVGKRSFPSLRKNEESRMNLDVSFVVRRTVDTNQVQTNEPEEVGLMETKKSSEEDVRVVPRLVNTQVTPASSSTLILPTPISTRSLSQDSVSEISSAKVSSKATLILEDQPLFLSSAPRSQSTISNLLVSSPNEVASPLYEEKKIAPKSSGGSFVHNSAIFPGAPKHESKDEASSLTVDVWELQRKKELERIEKSRLAEEKKKRIIRRDEEHRILGREWVAKRSRVINVVKNPAFRLLSQINRLNSTDGILRLEEAVRDGINELTIASIVAIISHKMLSEPIEKRLDGKSRIVDVLKKKKELSALLRKTQLRFSSKKDCVDVYRSLSKAEQESLDVKLKRKVVRRLVLEGFWEDALTILSSDKLISSKKYGLEICFLQSLLLVEPEVQTKVIESAGEMFRLTEETGKEKRLLLIRLKKYSVKKSLLRQAIDSLDADEEIYSALMAASNETEVSELLQSMKKKGLDSEDLCVKRALLRKMVFQQNYPGLFEEIDKQKEVFGLLPFHLSVAMRAASKDPSVLGKVVELLRESHPEHALWALKKVLPKLYDRQMFSDIVCICDYFHACVPLDKLLPRGVAFYNEALVKVGREPLSKVSIVDIEYVKEERKDGEKKKMSVSVEAVDITFTTELLLEYARSRNWEKALETVRGLPVPVSESQVAAYPLLFNCALSASVDQVEIVQKIYDLMTEKGIHPNATTVNTILSSFSRSSLVKEAVAFLKKIPLELRDCNSYLIFFSLLAKRNMHSEIVEVFDEARKGGFKFPSSHFAVVLSVTVNHSWETSLRIFQDLIKIHGKGINETIKAQVFTCLNKNGRANEVRKLVKQLDSKKKKR